MRINLLIKYSMTYDLIIIGAGPAGISASYYASKKGLDYLCIEKLKIVSTICDLYPHGKHLFSTPAELEVYEGSFQFDGEEKPTREDLLKYYRDFAVKNKLNINSPEEVIDIQKNVSEASGDNDQNEDLFSVKTNIAEYLCKKVILTIGNQARPRKLGIPGEDLEVNDIQKVFYRLCEPKDYMNSKIIVVGGGDSAIEAALMLKKSELKNEVTLSYRKPDFFRLKENNVESIKKAHDDGSIKLIFNSNLKEIREKEVLIEIDGKEEIIPNDTVFVFIGSNSNTDFLEKLGLEIEDFKIVYNSDTYETSISGLYIAGDLTKEPLIKNAVRHGKEIVEKLV